MSTFVTTPQASRALSPAVLALCVGVAALLARLLYVHFFSTPMPYWDQWSAEGATALRPWVEGTLTWQTLISPHNEHRILPTRVVTVLTYMATGQWNNLYEARVGAAVFCAIPAVLVWHALRDAGTASGRWLLVPFAVLLSILPFAWENFLVGFQSQFYFLILSSVVAVALVARHHQSILAIAVAILLTIFAALTMASGMLTAIAVGATCMLAVLCSPGRRAPALVGTAVLAVIAIAAYAWIPVVAVNSGFRAQSAAEFVQAASRTLAWPARSGGFLVLVWLPATVMIGRMLIRRQAAPADLVMAGICIWSALQALAIAYGRGHEMRIPMSRYTELFVPGVFANAWFALQLWSLVSAPSRIRTAIRIVVVLFAMLVVYSLLGRVSKDVSRMQQFVGVARLQQENVLRYLSSGDPQALQVGQYEIPYPDAAGLKDYLDDPIIRHALPVGDDGRPTPP